MGVRARRPRYRTLADYLTQTGDTQQAVAARVGTTQAHISRLVRGVAIPRPELAARIAAYAQIPLDSFTRVHLAQREGAA